MSEARERRVLQEVEIDAPIEQVWEAVSTAEGLKRWYPLDARVDAGPDGKMVGGKMMASFGPGMEGTATILAWEPNRRYRIYEGGPGGAPAPLTAELPTLEQWLATNPTTMGPNVLDITLESRGGKTFMRLVHSGFVAGAPWEEEYWDSLEQGWPFMVAGLLHYMKYHIGKPRQVGWPFRNVAVDSDESWRRLAGPAGLGFDLGTVRVGQRFSLKTAAGIPLSGAVEFVKPPKMRVVVENMNNALLGVMIEKCGGPVMAGLWLSAFGVPQQQVDDFRDRWNEVLGRLFPEPPPAAPAMPGG